MIITLILWFILTEIITRVNTDYCLLQTPRTQSNLSEVTKNSINGTWNFIRKVDKYLYLALVPIFIEQIIIILLVVNVFKG